VSRPRVNEDARADYSARGGMFAYCGAGSNSPAVRVQAPLIWISTHAVHRRASGIMPAP